MKVGAAIERLVQIANRHGSDVEVFFDCPVCHQAFTPAEIALKAVVIPGERDERERQS